MKTKKNLIIGAASLAVAAVTAYAASAAGSVTVRTLGTLSA
jgi:hypothetical protein